MSIVRLTGNRDVAGGAIFFMLAVIWFPGTEFIPAVAPYQKYLTLGRVAATIVFVAMLVDRFD